LWGYTAWTPKASRKQLEVLYKCLKAKKVILHTILLGLGGSIHTSHTSMTFKSSALMHKKPIRLPSSEDLEGEKPPPASHLPDPH